MRDREENRESPVDFFDPEDLVAGESPPSGKDLGDPLMRVRRAGSPSDPDPRDEDLASEKDAAPKKTKTTSKETVSGAGHGERKRGRRGKRVGDVIESLLRASIDLPSFLVKGEASVPDAQRGKGMVLMELPIESIEVSEQPRKKFTDIERLAENIRRCGILQPVVVERIASEKGVSYRLLAGERRLRAAKLAEIETVPAVVFCGPLSRETRTILQLVENLQRVDLRPSELGRGLIAVCRRVAESLPEEEVPEAVLRDEREFARWAETLLKNALDRRRKLSPAGEAFLNVLQEVGLTPKQGVYAFRLMRFPEWVRELVDEGKVSISKLENYLRFLDDEEALRRAILEKKAFPPDANRAATVVERLKRAQSVLRRLTRRGMDLDLSSKEEKRLMRLLNELEWLERVLEKALKKKEKRKKP
ncbi:ParB/RepB/Spo0J family partition protein [Thermosulfurimonas sp. F29]|uniref:ParB/RepB/Spo0J family partition protein n=1 Tax=Thermosulfurimonas sp. F29 TaxID=2867247 RepID=UPI001C833A73|nr:ParB/RepB/Spo0J family partition protein [Thermosulfurimonas sp. F29]MBX6424216.1 ParB/RepB/Spo0J family partition protein [Thermosulfurimonas sp. F29]